MFGISFSEIVLILVIALLVFGPEQLPQIASKVGTFIFTLRRLLHSVRDDLYHNSGINELKQTGDEINTTYSRLKQQILPQVEYIHSETPDQPLHQPELDFDYEPELFETQ